MSRLHRESIKRQNRGGRVLAGLAACLMTASLLAPANLWGGRKTDHGWELLAVAYPDGREVEVALGGSERALSSQGACKVKWRDNVAALELEIQNLPSPEQLGWAGKQYVLWAIDSEKRAVNLGLLPLKSTDATWKGQVSQRIFGLLITAERDPQAAVPSNAVVMESLLPRDPSLVVPVFRVELSLVPSAG